MAIDERMLEAAGVATAGMGGDILFDTLLLALAVSLAACALNIITERWHGAYSFDLDLHGVQKVHKTRVSRTGGVAIAAGVLAVALYGTMGETGLAVQADSHAMLVLLLLAVGPAFLAGLLEDVSKRVSVRTRFCAILASAFLAAWLVGAHLPRLDTWGLDALLACAPLSVAVTLFAVAGVTNSINILDGFNGVAGATVVILLAGTGLLCWQAGDAPVTLLAVAGIGATCGFLMFNYPTGRLFMGDGGAYFLGFWVAEVAVLAIVRNPGINAWQVLAIHGYPVIEVLFSVYRRKILRDKPAGAPDRLHLHSLFYRRYACQRMRVRRYPWACNAGVACFVTTWLAGATLAAIFLGTSVAGALLLVALQVLVYIAIYMRLVRGHWGHCSALAVIFGLRPQPRAMRA